MCCRQMVVSGLEAVLCSFYCYLEDIKLFLFFFNLYGVSFALPHPLLLHLFVCVLVSSGRICVISLKTSCITSKDSFMEIYCVIQHKNHDTGPSYGMEKMPVPK